MSMTVAMSAILNIRRVSVEGQCSLNCRGFFCIWFSWGVLFVCLFWFFGHMASGIFVSQLGVEPRPWAMRAWSPNHWTTREFPLFYIWAILSIVETIFVNKCSVDFFFNISFHFENAYIMSPLGNLKIKEVLFTTEIKAIFFFWNQMLWKYESVVKFLLHFCNINTWFQSLLKENLYDIQREFLKAIPLGQTLMCISV